MEILLIIPRCEEAFARGQKAVEERFYNGKYYDACAGSLSFTVAAGAPKKLTWFTPTGFGTLEQMGTGYKFKVTWGSIVLKELIINGESVDIIEGISLKAGFAILHDKK